MPMLQTIIVDDEEFARSSLYFLLQENCENIHVTGIAKSVNEARILLSNNAVDLVFLDIAMPEENGFCLIPDIQKHKSQVIFTTAYDQYALKAIKANAVDYLLKPIDIDELKAATDKAHAFFLLNTNVSAKNENLSNLAANMASRNELRKISLPNGQGYTLVDIDEIVHIEAESNYSTFYFQNKEKITVSKSLKEYEELLPDHQFIRVHKSTIVNLNYLAEYNSKNGMELILKNGEKIAVSRRRASDFSDRVKSYINLK